MKHVCFLWLFFCMFACQSPAPAPTPVQSVPSATPAVQEKIPTVPPALEKINDQLEDGAKKVLQETRQIFVPEKPKADHDLPRVKVISDPSNFLSLTTFQVPKTVRFEAIMENESKSGSIKSYTWKVEKLGAILNGNDQTIHTAEGKTLTFTFQNPARYRVTVTVTNNFGDSASDSVSLWARP